MFDTDQDPQRALVAAFFGPRRIMLGVASTIALLGCVYLLLVAPILETTNRAIERAGAPAGPAIQYPGSEPAGAWQPFEDPGHQPVHVPGAHGSW